MTKRRKLKCYGRICYPKGIKHDRNKLIKYHGKNYCSKCLNKHKFDMKYRKILYHFIEDEYHILFPTGHMLKQIKDYVKNRNYTYFGILQSLEYMKKVQGKELTEHLTLGYVPYIYENARDWWLLNHQRAAKKENSVQGINNQVKSVHTKKRKPKKKIKKVDMNNILN